MNWLNQNGIAIQTIITGILVVVTAVYVVLTRSIAKSSFEQIRFSNQALRARFYRLDILLERILEMVSAIPRDNQLERWTRSVVLWTADDLKNINELMAEFVSSTKRGAVLLNRLSWIMETTVRNKSTPPLEGIDWSKFDFAQFYSAVTDVETTIAELKKDLGAFLRNMR